jgi:tetratricopeptide (TPR) repeat protein
MLKKLPKLFILLVLIAVLVKLAIPRLAVFYHNKGVEAFNNQRYEIGVKLFEKSLHITPSIETYDYLAHAYEKLSKIDHAMKLYNEIILNYPSYASAYVDLGEIYLEKHMFEESIDLMKRALEIMPRDQDIHKFLEKSYLYYANDFINQSLILYMTGKQFEAYHVLHNALKLNPDYAYAHYILGYYFYDNNDLEPAVLKMRDVIRIEPGYWQAHKLLGDIYFKKNEYSMAVDSYKKILDFNQYDYTVYNDIGISLMNMEDYSQAVIYLKEALRLSPKSKDVIFNLASTYKDIGLFDQAILEYHKLLDYDETYPNMHNSLADIYSIQGRKDLALDAYHREIECAQQRLVNNPDNASELNTLARAYNGINNYQKAKNIISRAIAMAPDYRDGYITLAAIEEKHNNLDSALKALYKAKSLTVYADFIDKHIANIRNKLYANINQAAPVKTEKVFTAKHRIFFKSGRSIEGIMHSRTEEEIILYVQAGNSSLEVALKADDIDSIVEYD